MSLSVRNTVNSRAGTGEQAMQAKKTMVTRQGLAQRSVLGEVGNRRQGLPGTAPAAKKQQANALPVPSVRKPLPRSKATSALPRQVTKPQPAPTAQPFSHAREQQELQGYSSGLLPALDVDADEPDPQMVAGYTQEIYLYMRLLEGRFHVRADHLAGSCVTPKMREVLVDWLVQVHLKFRLLPETLYLTVSVLDRFLQQDQGVSPAQLQLAGVTAMWVACKYEEIYAPEVSDFVVIADHSFTSEQIRVMERRVLTALNFDVGRPLPLHFLRRCSKAGAVDSRQHALAKYLLELSLQEYTLSSVPVSRLAAASLCLTLKVLNDPQTTEWDEHMTYYSFYSETQLQSVMATLAGVALKAVEKVDDMKAKRASVARKYAKEKFFCISKMVELTGSVMRQMAAREGL